MKARILNKRYIGTYTDSFINQYVDLVKDWELIDDIPTNEDLNCLKLMYDNDTYYEGATPEEIAQAELEKVPKMINGRQMKLQMLVDGISKNYVLAVINAIPDDFLRGKILIEWEEANYFERFNENLVALWLQLGKTESELNTFFINASQL